MPDSLVAVLYARRDHQFLLEGDVFTEDLLSTSIEYKRENRLTPLHLRPHPYEFALYHDI